MCIWVCVCDRLTSLQCVLSDRLAVHPQTGSSVGSHLDLILRPDDEVSNQTVINLCTGDVLQLKLTRQTRQSISEWEEERETVFLRSWLSKSLAYASDSFAWECEKRVQNLLLKSFESFFLCCYLVFTVRFFVCGCSLVWRYKFNKIRKMKQEVVLNQHCLRLLWSICLQNYQLKVCWPF